MDNKYYCARYKLVVVAKKIMWWMGTRISARSLETNLLIEIALFTSCGLFRCIENSAHVCLVLDIQLLAGMLHCPQANTSYMSIRRAGSEGRAGRPSRILQVYT
jgi:hypothetical protein